MCHASAATTTTTSTSTRLTGEQSRSRKNISLSSKSLTGNLRLMWSGMALERWSAHSRPPKAISYDNRSYLSSRGDSAKLEKTSIRLSLAWRAKLRPETGDHGQRISPLVNTDRKGGAFPLSCCSNSSGVLSESLLPGVMPDISSADSTMYGPHQRKQLPHAERTTATTDGNNTNTDGRVGFHNTPRMGIEHTSNSGMDTTSACPNRHRKTH